MIPAPDRSSEDAEDVAAAAPLCVLRGEVLFAGSAPGRRGRLSLGRGIEGPGGPLPAVPQELQDVAPEVDDVLVLDPHRGELQRRGAASGEGGVVGAKGGRDDSGVEVDRGLRRLEVRLQWLPEDGHANAAGR